MGENISDRQETYLARVRRIAGEGRKSIVIYGAGNTGRKLLRLLQRNHMEPVAFCVTDTKFNPDQVNGIPVYSLEELLPSLKKQGAAVLLGALPPVNERMVEELKKRGIRDYVDIPKDMRHIVDDVSTRPTLEITSRIGCSIHCRFCPQDVLLKNYDVKTRAVMLSYDTFKKCLDKTPEDLIVDFAGFAEPFLNPDILPMMQYATKTGRDVRLYTTLVGLREDIFQEVVKLPFYRVVLHLPDCHNYAHIPLTEEYYSFLQRILLAKKSDGTPFVDQANGQDAPHPSILPYIERQVTVHQVLVDWAGNLEADELASTAVKQGKLICDYSVNQDHNVLLPDGTVVLCCMDWKSTCVMGNLLKDSYGEISHGSRKKEILHEMSREQGNENFICRNCTNSIQV